MLEKIYNVKEQSLTKIDFMIGQFFILPPFINLLGATISLPSLNFLIIRSINLVFKKSSAGYTIAQSPVDLLNPCFIASQEENHKNAPSSKAHQKYACSLTTDDIFWQLPASHHQTCIFVKRRGHIARKACKEHGLWSDL